MEAGVCVTIEMVEAALDQLRGAVMIVYPMGLPPYDPIRKEFENKEDLSGTQVCGSWAFCEVHHRPFDPSGYSILLCMQLPPPPAAVYLLLHVIFLFFSFIS